jgi:aminoglycoside phosphotransferase (APT) family kinase protein
LAFEHLPAERAAAALAELNVAVEADRVIVERREEKWLARLPDARIAWFAATDAARGSMALERRVLRVLDLRCRFPAPRVLAESPDGAIDVRAIVPGAVDPAGIFRRLSEEPVAAARLGAALGAILADLHTSVSAADVAEWLPSRPSWPEPREWIRERLPAVIPDDPALIVRADATIAAYEARLASLRDEDRALVHTDLGFHNLAFDPESLAIEGVFDWESACWGDPHLDFRYLWFSLDRHELLDSALAVYEAATGRRMSRSRIFLYNAACAVSYLAYRAGVPPEREWAGRTLAEDLTWTRQAIVEWTSRAERSSRAR